jgi:NADH-quinone oxidoreductase subunit N
MIDQLILVFTNYLNLLQIDFILLFYSLISVLNLLLNCLFLFFILNLIVPLINTFILEEISFEQINHHFNLTILIDNSFISYIGLYWELFLIICFSFLLFFLLIIENKFNNKVILTKLTGNLFIFILLLSSLILNNFNSIFFIFDFLLIQDTLGLFIKNILIVSLISCILISFNYISSEKIIHYEYFLLLSLSLIGMITMVSANDLTTLYIGVELQSLAFYLLTAFKIYNNFSTEAGLKYFILGAFSSGLLLFGCSLIYGFTGTTNFMDLQLLFINNQVPSDIFNGILLSSIFITVGILFKLGAAPFHMWLPDIYDGAPTSITAIFAIVPKIAIFTIFLRLSINLFSNTFFFWHQILIYSSILSIIIGTLGALYQDKIKKLLAYSAISHVGFLLIGFSTYNIVGFFALFFYIIVYILISLNIFSIILSLRKLDNNLKFKKINEFISLFKSNKIIAINFCIILFSIAGLPPLAGFYSKLYIFISAIKAEIYLITIIAAILSVIASMYYIRLIKLMFFKSFNYWVLLQEIPKLNSILMSSTLCFNILFFFYPEIITIYIYNNTLYFYTQYL